jgi:hypothetical protein
MRATLIAILFFALVGAGCTDPKKTEEEAARLAQTKADADAATARAAQAKAEAELAKVKSDAERGAAKGSESGSPAKTELAVPRQLAPADGSVLDQFPRKLTLRWAALAGAANVKYEVEVEYQEPDGKWTPYPAGKATGQTERELEFVGAQPGRWRVWAIDDGRNGPKSDWWTFRFTK